MAQVVELPDGTSIEFPDDMSNDDISAAVKSHLNPSETPSDSGYIKPDLFKANLDTLSASAAMTIGTFKGSALANSLGLEDNKEWYYKRATELGLEAEELSKSSKLLSLPTFDEKIEYLKSNPIEGAGDLLQNNLLTMLSYAGPSAAGAKLGVSLAGKAASKALTRSAAVAGGALANSTMQLGDTYKTQYDETGDVDSSTAIPAALAKGALDYASFGRLSGAGQTIAGGLGKRLLKGAVEGAVVEPVTEVAQEAIDRAASGQALTGSDAKEDYLNTALMTLIPGTVFGAAGNATHSTYGASGDTKAHAEGVLNEDISTAAVPSMTPFDSVTDAEKALKAAGIEPGIFNGPAEVVKAANTVVSRLADTQSKFYNANLSDDDATNTTLKGVLSQTTALRPLSSLLNAKEPLTSEAIEQASPGELASVFAEPPEDTVAPDLQPIENVKISSKPVTPVRNYNPRPPLRTSQLNTAASGEALAGEARVVAQSRQNATVGQPRTFTPNYGGGVIVDGWDAIQKDTSGIMDNMSVPNLMAYAKEVGVPETAVKDAAGKPLSKDNIKEAVMAHKLSKLPEENWKMAPATNFGKPGEDISAVPLHRVISDSLMPSVNSSNIFAKSAAVSPKIKGFTQQVSRIAKEVTLKLPVGKALTVNPDGSFSSPLKAAQASNFIYAATNLRNLANTDMPIALSEAWQFAYDEMSDADKATLHGALPKLAESISKANDINKHNIDNWMKSPLMQQEMLAHAFMSQAESRRNPKVKSLYTVPSEISMQFNKVYNALEKARQAGAGLGFTKFDDVFPAVAEQGVTPRELINQSVEAMRDERMKRLSDDMQFRHWRDLDRSQVSSLAKDAVQKTKEMEDLGLYTRSVFSTMVHLASRNPVAGLIFNLKRSQEDLQANNALNFAKAGQAWFREKSNDVKIKAAEVIDHLRNTEQSLSRDFNGNLTFERDGKFVTISHPRMLAAIDGLQAHGQAILTQAEGDTRTSIAKILGNDPAASLDDIKDAAATADLSTTNRDFLETQIDALTNITNMKSRPYIPRMRFGGYGFTVHAKENLTESGKVKPNTEPLYHAQVEGGKHLGRWNKLQYNEVQEALKHYRNNPDYVIYEDSKANPYEMTYNKVYDRLGADSLTMELVAGLVGTDKGEDYFKSVKDELDRNVQFKGYGRRFAEARNIPGYSKDWLRVIPSYHSASAHFFAKAQYAPVINSTLDTAMTSLGDERHTTLRNKLKSYVDYVSSPHDSFQAIRALNFIWTMGGNASTAALQFMTLPTTTLGSMMQYNSNIFSNAALITKNFKIAMQEFAKIVGDNQVTQFENGAFIFHMDNPKFLQKLKETHGFSQACVDFLKQAFADGRSGAAFLEEQTGNKAGETRSRSGKAVEKLGTISNLLGVPISAMEQATRFSTMASHFQMFEKNPRAVQKAMKVLAKDERWNAIRASSKNSLLTDLAYFGTDEAHAIFGKVGRGDLTRGGLGAFVFPFTTYPQQMMEFLIRMANGRGAGGKAGLVATLGMLYMLGGMVAMPGADLWKGLLEQAYQMYSGEDVDLEQQIRGKVTDETGSPRFAKFVTQGLGRSLLGLDISRRIGLPVMGQDLILAAIGSEKGDLTNLMGVQGSMLTQGVAAIKAYNSDATGARIATNVTPMAISNILKGYTYYTEGARTMNDTQLVSPEKMQDNPVQSVLRGIGLGTDMVASAREMQLWKDNLERQFLPYTEKMKTRGKNQLEQAIRAQNAGNPEVAEKWTERYQQTVQEAGEYLSSRGQIFNVKAFNKAAIEAISQRLTAGINVKNVSKANRGKLQGIVDATTGDNSALGGDLP